LDNFSLYKFKKSFKNKLISLVEEREILEKYVIIYGRISEILKDFDSLSIDTLRRKLLIDLENLNSILGPLPDRISRKEKILNSNVVSDNIPDSENEPNNEEKYEAYKEIRSLFDKGDIEGLKKYDLGSTYEEIVNSIKELRFDLIETNLIK